MGTNTLALRPAPASLLGEDEDAGRMLGIPSVFLVSGPGPASALRLRRGVPVVAQRNPTCAYHRNLCDGRSLPIRADRTRIQGVYAEQVGGRCVFTL